MFFWFYLLYHEKYHTIKKHIEFNHVWFAVAHGNKDILEKWGLPLVTANSLMSGIGRCILIYDSGPWYQSARNNCYAALFNLSTLKDFL